MSTSVVNESSFVFDVAVLWIPACAGMTSLEAKPSFGFSPMPPAPKSLRALKEERMLEITWSDGAAYRLPFKLVRVECPCAQCIHEITGERILKPESIPEDIHPTELGYSGNYALRIVWSDTHASGIFTWERLHGLCSHLQAVRVS